MSRDDWMKPSGELANYIYDLRELIYNHRRIGKFARGRNPLNDSRLFTELSEDLAYYEKQYARSLEPWVADDVKSKYTISDTKQITTTFGKSIEEELHKRGKWAYAWEKNTKILPSRERIVYPRATRANLHPTAKSEDQARIEELMRITSPDTSDYFSNIDYTHRNSANSFVVFDTEVDDKGRILSLSALRLRYDYNKKQLTSTEDNSVWNRHYIPKDIDVSKTESVHHLNFNILKALRGNSANYELEWGAKERDAFLKWVGGSVLVGHNIEEADIPWLYEKGMNSQWKGYKGAYIDTLHLARAIFKGLPNDLEALSERLGVPFESIEGLVHHDSFADTIITAKVLERLASKYSFIAKAFDIDKIRSTPYDARRAMQGFSGLFKKASGGYIMDDDDYYPSEETLALMGADDEAAQKRELGNAARNTEFNSGFGFTDEEAREYIDDYIASRVGTPASNLVDRASDEYHYVQEAKAALKANPSLTYEQLRSLMKGAYLLSGSRETAALDRAWTIKREYVKEGEPDPLVTRVADVAREQSLGIGRSNPVERLTRVNAARAARRQDNRELLDKASPFLRLEDRFSLYDKLNMPTEKFAETIEQLSHNIQNANKNTTTWSDSLVKGLASIKANWFDWTRIGSAYIQGQQEINHATAGLVPNFMREPVSRMLTAGLELKRGQQAIWNSRVNNAGSLLQAGGTIAALTMGANPIVGAVLGVVGALGTQIIGRTVEANVQKQALDRASKINYLSAGIEALLLPLKLFRNGLGLTLGLFNKFAGIISRQYGLPTTYLTGIQEGHYLAMQGSDKLMGMKPGTLNAMQNNAGLAAASLYTSGAFNQQQLVAASRLGVFQYMYAPLGSNTEHMYANMVDKLTGDLRNADPATRQSTMSLINALDPNLMNVVNRISKYENYLGRQISFKQIQDGSIFDIWQRDMNSPAWKNRLAKWEFTAGEFEASRNQLDFGIKNIASSLWEPVGKPAMNYLNKTVAKLEGVSSLKEVGAVLKQVWKDATAEIDIQSWKPQISSVLEDTILPVVKSAWAWIMAQQDDLKRFLEPVVSMFEDTLADVKIVRKGLQFSLESNSSIAKSNIDTQIAKLKNDPIARRNKLAAMQSINGFSVEMPEALATAISGSIPSEIAARPNIVEPIIRYGIQKAQKEGYITASQAEQYLQSISANAGAYNQTQANTQNAMSDYNNSVFMLTRLVDSFIDAAEQNSSKKHAEEASQSKTTTENIVTIGLTPDAERMFKIVTFKSPFDKRGIVTAEGSGVRRR